MIRSAALVAALSLALSGAVAARAEHRQDCDTMRGTAYEHPSERPWFWANCVLDIYGGGVSSVPLPPRSEAPGGSAVYGHVTHYGYSYNGSPLGCPGYGLYWSSDPTIAASAYNLATGARPYQCGERLEVCGDAGCQVVVVKDACPGCGWNHLDLSESAKVIVCGELGDNCAVSIRRLW